MLKRDHIPPNKFWSRDLGIFLNLAGGGSAKSIPSFKNTFYFTTRPRYLEHCSWPTLATLSHSPVSGSRRGRSGPPQTASWSCWAPPPGSGTRPPVTPGMPTIASEMIKHIFMSGYYVAINSLDAVTSFYTALHSDSITTLLSITFMAIEII